MMASGALPAARADVEVGGEAVAVALDDAGGEALLDRPVGAVLLLDGGWRVTPSNIASSTWSGS